MVDVDRVGGTGARGGMASRLGVGVRGPPPPPWPAEKRRGYVLPHHRHGGILARFHVWLLLDSRVVDVPMASNPTFVMLSFFNVENSVMLCRLCKYILFQWSFIIVAT